jgi:hypothetical protein
LAPSRVSLGRYRCQASSSGIPCTTARMNAKWPTWSLRERSAAGRRTDRTAGSEGRLVCARGDASIASADDVAHVPSPAAQRQRQRRPLQARGPSHSARRRPKVKHGTWCCTRCWPAELCAHQAKLAGADVQQPLPQRCCRGPI